MKYPIFAHGTLASVKKAIESGKIKYPAYCWIDDQDTYSFLNKNGELEICGIPKKSGSLDNILILSELDDGIYEISGQHKITDFSETIFQDSSVIVLIKTTDNIKKIRRITADDFSTYIIDGETISVDTVATQSYLDEKGYVNEETIDEKMAALEVSIKNDISASLPSLIEPILDEMIQSEDDENIRGLFN